jgi:hypothetical protein
VIKRGERISLDGQATHEYNSTSSSCSNQGIEW